MGKSIIPLHYLILPPLNSKETRSFLPSTVSFHRAKKDLELLALTGRVNSAGEVRESVDKYLQQQPSSEVRSLADIIQFNKEHPELQAGIGMRKTTYLHTKLRVPLTYD